MATDYDSPRKTDDDLGEDSLQELQARRMDKSSSTIDLDPDDAAEGLELPGADLVQRGALVPGDPEAGRRVHLLALLPCAPPQPACRGAERPADLPRVRRLAETPFFLPRPGVLAPGPRKERSAGPGGLDARGAGHVDRRSSCARARVPQRQRPSADRPRRLASLASRCPSAQLDSLPCHRRTCASWSERERTSPRQPWRRPVQGLGQQVRGRDLPGDLGPHGRQHLAQQEHASGHRHRGH